MFLLARLNPTGTLERAGSVSYGLDPDTRKRLRAAMEAQALRDGAHQDEGRARPRCRLTRPGRRELGPEAGPAPDTARLKPLSGEPGSAFGSRVSLLRPGLRSHAPNDRDTDR